jgi:hypothetical protein
MPRRDEVFHHRDNSGCRPNIVAGNAPVNDMPGASARRKWLHWRQACVGAFCVDMIATLGRSIAVFVLKLARFYLKQNRALACFLDMLSSCAPVPAPLEDAMASLAAPGSEFGR